MDPFCDISISLPEWALCMLPTLKAQITMRSQQRGFFFSLMVVRHLYNNPTCLYFIAFTFLLSLALADSWLILWPAVIQYKIGELNLVFDLVLYLSVCCRTVNYMKTKGAYLFLCLITSVIKTFNKYFLGHLFPGKFFTWFYSRNKQTNPTNQPKQTTKPNQPKPKKNQRKEISNSCILWLPMRVINASKSGMEICKGPEWGFSLNRQITRKRKTRNIKLEMTVRKSVSCSVAH